LLIWGATSAVISFLIGMGAYSIAGRLEKPYRIGGNTLRLHMTYIVRCY
jgi:hypothetical protein